MTGRRALGHTRCANWNRTDAFVELPAAMAAFTTDRGRIMDGRIEEFTNGYRRMTHFASAAPHLDRISNICSRAGLIAARIHVAPAAPKGGQEERSNDKC